MCVGGCVRLLAFVKVDVQIQLYRYLSLKFNWHENKTVQRGGFADRQADVRTEAEHDFGVNVENTN